ncbi:MAG: glycosyltransferase [Bacteroidales bacterium]|nr:glycosyltransferase [Bacteroidales bacterium]
MEILLVITSLDVSRGGPSRSVPTLAKGLAEAGHGVTIMTVGSERMNVAPLEGTPVKVAALSPRATRAEMERVFDEGHFDVVQAQGLWEIFNRRVQHIAQKRGIPFVATPRGSLEPWALELHAWKKLLAMFLYQKRDLRKAAGILATSKMEAEHIREVTGRDSYVIPNGLDMSEFPCRTAESKKQVLFLSRIHPKKGLEVLIEAWGAVHEAHPDWNLVIAGNGDLLYIEEIRGLISRKGLARSISLLPPRFGEDKIRLYHESALFVLPSYSENFGMVVAEAMACGLPVITTDATPWQVLNEKGLGWCIELSQENLAQALDTALECDLYGLAAMGQRASQYVREAFDYRKVARAVADMFADVIAKTQKPQKNETA